MSTLELIIYLSIIIILLGIVVFFFIVNSLFKHRVIVRDMGDNDLVVFDRAKEKRKDGVLYWQLAKEKVKELKYVTPPPKDAICLTKKGHRVAEAFRSPEGNYIWIPTTSNKLNLRTKEFKPLTSNQRMILMNNFQKANARKGFSWKENIPTVVSIGALLILVVSLMVFWGDIAAPALKGREIAKEERVIQLQIVQLLQDIKTGQQTIKDEVKAGEPAPN